MDWNLSEGAPMSKCKILSFGFFLLTIGRLEMSANATMPIERDGKNRSVIPCQQDKQKIIKDFEKKLNGELQTVQKTVPKDLEMIQGPFAFIVIKDLAPVFKLPNSNGKAFYYLGGEYRGSASCQVKDGHGALWYALPLKDGVITYLSGRDAMLESDYDKMDPKSRYRRLPHDL
jgi:hypothetical protein